MERRLLLKNLALGVATAFVLPDWANAWHPQSSIFESGLTKIELETLANLVEAILPSTDTKGAREIGVHKFVVLMVKDCYEPKAFVLLKNGLKTIDEHSKTLTGKSISEADAKANLQTINSFKALGISQIEFINLIKQNTITGYLNSEYVMTNLRVYQMVPGKYVGEVKVG